MEVFIVNVLLGGSWQGGGKRGGELRSWKCSSQWFSFLLWVFTWCNVIDGITEIKLKQNSIKGVPISILTKWFMKYVFLGGGGSWRCGGGISRKWGLWLCYWISLILKGGVQGKDLCGYVVGCVWGGERRRRINIIYVTVWFESRVFHFHFVDL